MITEVQKRENTLYTNSPKKVTELLQKRSEHHKYKSKDDREAYDLLSLQISAHLVPKEEWLGGLRCQ